MRLRLAPEPALSLAALRVVVPAMMLLAPGFLHAREVAAFEPARRVAPEGLAWFAVHVPITPALVVAVQVVAATSALFAVVGMQARRALPVLLVASAYLFAVSDLAGFVWHELHLLWLCALLVVSPCDHVLALDADRPVRTEGREYAPALWTVRLLLGVIYFFPGYHKLKTSGLGWALGDNLKYQLYWKWFEHGVLPTWRIDRHPAFLAIGGLGVLAFELSFVALMLWRRARPFAAACGVGFHLMTQLLLRIPFASIWLCYVAVVDLRPALGAAERTLGWAVPFIRRLELGTAASESRSIRGAQLPVWVTLAVSTLLVGAATIQGARGQTQSFPFACYPTFDTQPPPVIPDLEIVRRSVDGSETPVAHARSPSGYRSQRQWAEIWSLAGLTARLDPARLRAYYAAIAREHPELGRDTAEVAFNRADLSVIPEDRGRPPVRRIRLYTMAVTPIAGSRAR